MSSEANKRLFLEYFQQVCIEGRLDELSRFVADDYIDHNNPDETSTGPAAVAAHVRALRVTFPDFTVRMHEVIAEGEWVAARVSAQGTHLGGWMGIKATGKVVKLRGINLDRIVGGRIVEHWGEADTVGMLMQMGVDPFRNVSD